MQHSPILSTTYLGVFHKIVIDHRTGVQCCLRRRLAALAIFNPWF